MYGSCEDESDSLERRTEVEQVEGGIDGRCLAVDFKLVREDMISGRSQ